MTSGSLLQRRGLLVRTVYALCLVGATINHVRAILTRGWFPEHLPAATALYWSSLTFLDPLAAVLLFVRPRIGVVLTIMIIVSDVVHNLWFTAAHPIHDSLLEDVTTSAFMMSQIAFLFFVAGTAGLAWRESNQAGPSHPLSDDPDRLLRHDLVLAWNVLRATFARWSDRLLAAFLLVVALAGARAWITNQPEGIARWVALAVGILVGLAVAGGINARVVYQQSDGLLAADALHLRPRLRYDAAGHMLGLFLLALVTVIVEPSLILMTIAGYAAGAIVPIVIRTLDAGRLAGSRTRADWTIKAWSNRLESGVGAAALLILLLLPARSQGTTIQWALAGSATLLIGLLLSQIESATIRFRTSVGQGFGQIFIAHSKGLLSFLAVAVAASWATIGAQGAAVVATAASLLLLLFALRILAYRLLERRGADLLVSILVGLLALVGYSLTPALPFVAILMLWQLHRHGEKRRWLML